MKSVIRVCLLVICSVAFFAVILFPPFYLHPKYYRDAKWVESYWGEIILDDSALSELKDSKIFLRREWRFLFFEGGKVGCLPLDWSMLALELIGVFGIWFGTWVVLRMIRNGNPKIKRKND